MRLYSICLSLFELFHLAQYTCSSSMLSQMERSHSFLWLNNIPQCLYPFIHRWALRSFLYTVNRLQWTWGYRYFFKLLFSFSSENVVLFLIFWGTFILFPQLLHQFKFPPTAYKDFLFSVSLPTLVIFLSFSMLAILTDMRWCIQVVLICIFLWWLELPSIFTCIYWPCLQISW